MPTRPLFACLLATLVAGCGIKGPLYLPTPATDQQGGQADHSKAPTASPR
ncbi:MAG: lipoprotein [Rhodocyclaceae bacterium]|nr:lipoprotein [Rhodocyclaceae bacterium]